METRRCFFQRFQAGYLLPVLNIAHFDEGLPGLRSNHSSVRRKVSFSNHTLKSHLRLPFLTFLAAFDFAALIPSPSFCWFPILIRCFFSFSPLCWRVESEVTPQMYKPFFKQHCHCTSGAAWPGSCARQLVTSCHHPHCDWEPFIRDHGIPATVLQVPRLRLIRLALGLPFRPDST